MLKMVVTCLALLAFLPSYASSTPQFSNLELIGSINSSSLIQNIPFTPIAIDSHNTAIAVFPFGDGVGWSYLIEGSRTWSDPELIAAANLENLPSILLLPTSTQAGAFWIDVDGNLFGAVLDTSTILQGEPSWSLLKSPISNVSSPAFSIDSEGNGLAVWIDSTTMATVHAATFDSTTLSFSSTAQISPTFLSVNAPKVFYSENGTGVAVYGGAATEDSSTPTDYLYSGYGSYYNGTSWEIRSSPIVPTIGTQLACDISGNNSGYAVAVFYSRFPTQSEFELNSVVNLGGAWESPILISDEVPDDVYVVVKVDPLTSTAITAYNITNPTSTYLVSNSLIKGGDAWTNQLTLFQRPPLSQNQGFVPFFPNLAISPQGNVWCLFTISPITGPFETLTFAATLLNNSGTEWGKPQFFTDFQEEQIGIGIAAGKDRYTAILGCVSNANHPDFFDVFATHTLTSRLPDSNVKPPRQVQGIQKGIDFLFQANIFNKITWKAPRNGPQPILYKIYRDASLKDPIGIIDAQGPLVFEDLNVPLNTPITYYVVSLTNNGKESNPAIIKVKPNK